MIDPKDVTNLIEGAGGTVDADSVMALPDGSGCMTASFPLPDDHWLYAESEEDEQPPAPMLMGTDDPRRIDWQASIVKAAQYAIRAATMNGKIDDFDPDAMVQNFVVAMLGLNTSAGL